LSQRKGDLRGPTISVRKNGLIRLLSSGMEEFRSLKERGGSAIYLGSHKRWDQAIGPNVRPIGGVTKKRANRGE